MLGIPIGTGQAVAFGFGDAPDGRINIGDGSRKNSHADMVKVLKPYSQAQLEAVADHMSRLPPPGR